jgi:hypothetical protein
MPTYQLSAFMLSATVCADADTAIVAAANNKTNFFMFL